jgi:transglutaminase-like putative cysteine protease
VTREPPDPAAEPVSGPPTAADLASTETFDHRAPAVRAWAWAVIGDAEDPAVRARLLFAAVRDRIRYDPYRVDPERSAFTASAVLESEANWCVPKSILLAAGARAAAIPARIGFADVRNHLSSDRLRAWMGSDLFVFHGYVALHVGDAWHKVSPAFNAELCARFGVPPLEFDGHSDALLHAYDGAGRRHMEYVSDHGTWTDVPLSAMFAAFKEAYDRAPMLAAQRHQDPAFDS